MSTENPQSGAMKLAHVLFMDIVGYSKLPIDEQDKCAAHPPGNGACLA